ncbi:MAG: hypothetical protein AB8B91_21150 [Rubripirellula sp.]
MKNFTTEDQKLSVSCPAGHHLRGGVELMGKRVKCPRCQAAFVFAPTRPPEAKPEPKSVTESGVMRILGDMSPLPPSPKARAVSTRPCTRCGVAINETLSVCPHCACYVGALPKFMQQMTDQTRDSA